MRDPEAARALAGVDVLYHLGFQLWSGKGGPAAMAAANLEGTANVLSARPGRVVLASSAAVYGAWPDNPVPMGEEHVARPNPECPYAEHKLAVERMCAGEVPTVALRIGAVLGDHAERRVARAALAYRLVVPAVRGVTQALQFVDEADVVDALRGSGAATATGVVNVATSDWLDAPAVASVAGGRVVAVPRRVLIGASEVGRRARLLPFGADRAVLLSGPLALSVDRAADVLGWRPSRTSREVLAGATHRPWRTY
jgi:UDP-glucose 4-epimerase